jgi:hypothetical protein
MNQRQIKQAIYLSGTRGDYQVHHEIEGEAIICRVPSVAIGNAIVQALRERQGLRVPPRDAEPVRVIVDISGGVYGGVSADRPATVMVVDADEKWEYRRTEVPGFPGSADDRRVWSSIMNAAVERDFVRRAFEGRVEIDIDEEEAA